MAATPPFSFGPGLTERASVGEMVRWLNTQLPKFAGAYSQHGHGWTDIGTFGAAGNGTTDDAAKLRSALARGGLILGTPGANYRVKSVLNGIVSNTVLDGRGATFTKGFSDSGPTETHILESFGAEGTTTALSANVSIGDAALSVASGGTSYSDGDWVLIRDGTYEYGTTGRNQQLNRVSGAPTATSIPLAWRTFRSFATASTAQVVKVTLAENVVIKNCRFVLPSGTTGGNVYLNLCANWRFVDCEFVGPNNDPGLGMERSFGVIADRCRFRDGQRVSTGGCGYGLLVNESSHHCGARRSQFENLRENNYTNGIRHCFYVDNDDVGMYDSAVNTHGSGCQHVLIDTVRSTSARTYVVAVGHAGSLAPDRDVVVRNVQAWHPGADAVSVATDGVFRNARVTVDDVKVYGSGRRTSASGVVAQYTDGLTIGRVECFGDNVTTFAQGVYVLNCTKVRLDGLAVEDIDNGYGLRLSNVTTVRASNLRFKDVSSYNIEMIGTNSDVRIDDVEADDSLFVFDASVKLSAKRPHASADNGDADKTLVTLSEPVQRFDTALTLNRVVNLPTNGTSANGLRFRIVRTALGAGTLTVRDASAVTVKTMPAATAAWCEVGFANGSWRLEAYGTL